MTIQRFFGRGGMARYLQISEARVGQLDLPPDATVDGRPIWSPQTAARLRLERETQRAERGARKRPRTVQAPA